jgi:hypothetical protein
MMADSGCWGSSGRALSRVRRVGLRKRVGRVYGRRFDRGRVEGWCLGCWRMRQIQIRCPPRSQARSGASSSRPIGGGCLLHRQITTVTRSGMLRRRQTKQNAALTASSSQSNTKGLPAKRRRALVGPAEGQAMSRRPTHHGPRVRMIVRSVWARGALDLRWSPPRYERSSTTSGPTRGVSLWP